MNIEQFAEVKGYLCGFICTGLQSEGRTWLEALTGGLQIFDFDFSTERHTLIELYKQISEEMESQTLDLRNTLFEKSLPLKTRAAALKQWCAGFVAGLMQSGLPLRQIESSADLSQTLRQFEGISTLDIEKLDISEADEAAFTNITDFIEQAVFHIYQLFIQQKTKH